MEKPCVRGASNMKQTNKKKTDNNKHYSDNDRVYNERQAAQSDVRRMLIMWRFLNE